MHLGFDVRSKPRKKVLPRRQKNKPGWRWVGSPLGTQHLAALIRSTTFYGATAQNYFRILFHLMSRKSAMYEADVFARTEEASTTGYY